MLDSSLPRARQPCRPAQDADDDEERMGAVAGARSPCNPGPVGQAASSPVRVASRDRYERRYRSGSRRSEKTARRIASFFQRGGAADVVSTCTVPLNGDHIAIIDARFAPVSQRRVDLARLPVGRGQEKAESHECAPSACPALRQRARGSADRRRRLIFATLRPAVQSAQRSGMAHGLPGCGSRRRLRSGVEFPATDGLPGHEPRYGRSSPCYRCFGDVVFVDSCNRRRRCGV